MAGRKWRLLSGLALALALLLLNAASSDAVFHQGAPPAHPARGSNTELVVSGGGPGRAVNGFVPSPDNPFDPVTEDYPLTNPTTGFTRLDATAEILYGRPTGSREQLKLYCINVSAYTRQGIGYSHGTWDAANVPNMGYVARVLNDYYPATGEPASLPEYDRAAAVQAAIWYFSDGYVVSTTSNTKVRNGAIEIVNHVKAQGPLIETPPSLSIDPPHQSGSAGGVVGPFTLNTNNRVRGHRRFRIALEATVTATGGDMFSNSAGTAPIANGATVASGQKIWMRSTGPSIAELQATATASVPTGSVYLYDGNALLDDYQELVLADTAQLTTTVQATAEFLDPGSLVVTKTIAGPAAGLQGRIVIHPVCDDGTVRPDFVIDAGAPAGARSRTYGNIPAGTVCAAIETINGSVTGTDVVVTGDGQVVTIPAGGRHHVDVTDSYHHVTVPAPNPGSGSLLVTKTIAGPLAGHQGQVTIHVVCNGSTLAPLVIHANSPAGSVSHSYKDIPAHSACTVTETGDGTTDTVATNVAGSGQSVTISAGKVVPVNMMDVYYQRPSGLDPDVITRPSGALRVTKTIAGPDAGRQGPIAIDVACGGPLHAFAFLIPAHTGPGSVSRVFPNLPPGARCIVTETAAGRTTTVNAVTTRRRTATIPVNGTATVHLSDSYFPVPVAPLTGGLG